MFNSAGEKVGEVESALIDQDGKVRYVIVGVGGFLGLGERDVALRWDQLTMADNDQKIVVNMTKEQLTALPAHRFADASSKGKVYAYDEDLKTNAYLSNDAGTAMASSSAVDTKKLIGRNIKNPAGDTVGEIESVLVDQAGNVKYVVVGVGGFLGIGEKHIALSWDSLTITDNGEKVMADVTKDSLKGLPDYRYADPASRGTVSSYDDTLKDNPYLADNSTATPPLPGANSFTESQARERIEAKGFTSGDRAEEGRPVHLARHGDEGRTDRQCRSRLQGQRRRPVASLARALLPWERRPRSLRNTHQINARQYDHSDNHQALRRL